MIRTVAMKALEVLEEILNDNDSCHEGFGGP